ncbi:MAG: hypothetical protein KA369_16455 [Spirochaetes bacterium]|nr:hypothetical protein [Spirochaetota bacterium]
MFTTNNHVYLYAAGGIFAAAALLYLLRKRTASLIVLCAGFLLYTLYLFGRGWIAGTFLPNPLVEGPFLLPWYLAVILIIMGLKKSERWGLVLIPLLLSVCFAAWYAKGIIPPTPNKLTLWAIAFFTVEIFGHACFYCAALFAAALLAGKENTDTFHDLAVWGFLLYSIAQVIGAVWCFLGWGNTFQWGPRHMSSTAIWLIYASYIHLRYISGWNVKRRAWFVILASLIVLAVTSSSYLNENSFPRIGG